MEAGEPRRSQRQRRQYSQTSRGAPEASASISPPAPTEQLSQPLQPLLMERSAAGEPVSSSALQQPSSSEAATRPELTEQQVRGLVLGSRNSRKARMERMRGIVKQKGLISAGQQAAQAPASAASASAAAAASHGSSSDADPISYSELAANHIFVTRVMEPDTAASNAAADLERLDHLAKPERSVYKKSKIRDHPSRLDRKGKINQRLANSSARWQSQLPDDSKVNSTVLLLIAALLTCASRRTHIHTHHCALTLSARLQWCVAGS